jgi:hypothetical protein
MARFYIQLTNDETAPRYVERGLGFGGVKLTDSLRSAKRYDTEQEAEKIAALARAQKDKERGGECTTVEIVREGGEDPPDGWEIRARFEVPSIDASSAFEMKKTDAGIMSSYVGIDGKTSREYGGSEMKEAISDWINATGAWFASKVGKKATG